MNFIINIIENKKSKYIIWSLWAILGIVIIINSIFTNKLEFNSYYMIIVHILAIYWFIFISNYILKENINNFKLIILDSRIFFLIALILLSYTPFYIILENKELAEKLSIYAYYFLVIWVIYELILSKFQNKIEAFKNEIENNKKVKQREKERKEKLAWKRKQKKK